MSYQVFTRRATYRGGSGRPRRYSVEPTQDAARAVCEACNARLTAKQRREGLRYEYAALAWYTEAFL